MKPSPSSKEALHFSWRLRLITLSAWLMMTFRRNRCCQCQGLDVKTCVCACVSQNPCTTSALIKHELEGLGWLPVQQLGMVFQEMQLVSASALCLGCVIEQQLRRNHILDDLVAGCSDQIHLGLQAARPQTSST